MSTENASDFQELVARVAGPRLPADNRKSWLARAARRAGISASACKRIWYGEISDEYNKNVVRLREAAGELHLRASDLHDSTPSNRSERLDRLRRLADELRDLLNQEE